MLQFSQNDLGVVFMLNGDGRVKLNTELRQMMEVGGGGVGRRKVPA